MSGLAPFLGRFHPLLVHFPIALLAAGAALAAWCGWLARRGLPAPLRPAVAPLLWLGAASAVAAATTGYLLGSAGGYGGLVFERHEAIGITVAVSAVLTALVSTLCARRPSRALRAAYGVLIAHTLFVLTGAGHLGATLTHGEGYLTARAPRALRSALARVGLAAAEPVRGTPEQVVAFEALVQPILRARCADCHGQHEAMGRLRLDTAEGVRRGGEHGPVVVPGRAAASDLLRRISLPASAAHAMPPLGRRPVTAGEGAVLRWWIDAGAPYERRLGELELPADLRPLIEATLGPLSTGGPTLPRAAVPAPDPAAIASLAARGLAVKPVAGGVPFVDVRVARSAASFGDADLALLKPLAAQIVWLDLAGSAVTDAGLPTIAALPNVIRLDLSRTAVADVAPLSALQQLEVLNLRGTRAADANLASLAGVKTLRRVYLWQTAVTPAGVERLRSALPRLVVDTGDAPEALAVAVGAATAPPAASR